MTPALWGRIPDGCWDDHAPYEPPHDKGTAIDRLSLPSINLFFLPILGDYHKQDVHPPDDCSHHQKVDVPHEEQKKKWYDLEDDRKKQLEVQIFFFHLRIPVRRLMTSCWLDRRWALGRCCPSRRWLLRLARTREEEN